MATIVLSAAGAALGGAIGGGVAGLPAVAIGRAVGAVAGRVLDDRLLGSGSEAVEIGRMDRFRLTQAGEGAAIPTVFGRMRVGGQVIWASDFQETTSTSRGGGKGAPRRPKTTQYSYSVSLAVAVCSGEIASISRVWADGEEIAAETLNMRIYPGSRTQLPDPTIEAIEGAGNVPAYRGTAYVVMEDLALEAFGNRVPQFSFEVVRPEQAVAGKAATGLGNVIPAVALMPGTGEYALATDIVHVEQSPGRLRAVNANSPSGKSDFVTSFEHLQGEVPASKAASLVVSWFGSDLRCGSCEIRPKVEQAQADGREQGWQVAGISRSQADEVAAEDGRPIYGGTPSDASVTQAIRHMRDSGQKVMFYPFILMEQRAGNNLPNPWTGETGQPALPWRGRITLSKAPGLDGTPDQSATADQEVSAFFGTAAASDFVVSEGDVNYFGPAEWGMRRFILHNAALCAAAGGVDAFCIGSEMRGLTQIRGAAGFPAVEALRALAGEVRQILGPDVKIGYAADWSEYFGYQPPEGGGSHLFHLDPLWADPEIDFVGIDNYMPISDWRDGEDHLDRQAGWKDIYDPAYLASNIEGGEGYDWYYASEQSAIAQNRTPISDEAHDEDWIWRYKDIRNWWSNEHHDRVNGIRQSQPTSWVPGSKPIFFTELGCAAIDRGTNEPNRFLDVKSSESGLPRFSRGYRDDFIQMQYLKTVLGYWGDEANNPWSDAYGGRMIDMANAYVWAWDARPYPQFPNQSELWSDGENFLRGHWVNGRVGASSLASVVQEICAAAGLGDVDVTRLYGVVPGYLVGDVVDARAALQPLMLRYGFDAIERNGALIFQMRTGQGAVEIDPDFLVETGETDALLDLSREAEAEISGRVRLRYIQAGADHETRAEEAVLPDDATHAVHATELPIAMTQGEARHVSERWLAESRIARDTVKFGLPPSLSWLGAGDVVKLPVTAETDARFRIDSVEQSGFQLIQAVRIESAVYEQSDVSVELASARAFSSPVPVTSTFLDLPLMTGDEIPHAPHVAIAADPWPGAVAIYSSASDENYALSQIVASRSVVGHTQGPLAAARPGVWDEGPGLQIHMTEGQLESRERAAVLNGANLIAIGDGSPGNWELIQFSKAELIDTDTYLVSGRLRGQLGSDAVMPDIWPTGSMVVVLEGQEQQLELASSQRRISQHFRIGPAQRGYDDPSYVYQVEAFDGNGLRPYSPCHPSAEVLGSGAAQIQWIRRTRIEGDSWDLPEVPLGEEVELYRIRVFDGETLLREDTVESPAWTYGATDRASDNAQSNVSIEVAQLSARYGAGPGRRINLPAVS
ncbi:MAG: baseplate multidomain protein megatron [Paracoccaceae bacterium]